MKKLDDTVKEIQKALSEAREKIARLEGQQVPMKASGIPPTSKD
jgi:predicted  nucleic acid-binding Zn-ribbon protein